MEMPSLTYLSSNTLLWATMPPTPDVSVQPYLMVLGLNCSERGNGWEEGRLGGSKILTWTHNQPYFMYQILYHN